MTRPGIEPRSPGPLANTLTAGPQKTFLDELQVNDKIVELPCDLSLYNVVRWLSAYKVLSRFVELLDPVITFTKEKGKK